MVAHRLFNLEQTNGKYLLTTKGDTSKKNDEPFTDETYVGKVTAYTRKGKKVNIEKFISRVCGYFIVKTSFINTPLFILNKKVMRRWNNR